jgi:rhodanese-related sulfurtransferase
VTDDVEPRPRVTVLLERARARLERMTPELAYAAAQEGALLVDTRSAAQREVGGLVPGAIVIERNSLEWRLDPTSPWRTPEIADVDQRVIIMCEEGYASTLAAVSLQDLGLTHATDVIGGFQAWNAAGLPVSPVASL